MARLGAAGLCLVPTLLAITRRRLGKGAGRLLRPLHAQHQIDQLFLRETLQITSIHVPRDSEIAPADKDWVITPPEHSLSQDAVVDALLRDVRARQEMVRALFEDEDAAIPLPFVGSMSMRDGAKPCFTRSARRLSRLSIHEG